MMDPIVQQIVALLQPYLPALVMESAKAIGSEGGKRIVNAIWEKLKGKPKVVEAAQEVVEAQGNETLQSIFALRIEQALKDDHELLAELTELLSQAGNVAHTSGPGSIAIGGNVNGSTIVAGNNNIVGNNNTVQQGKYNIRADKITGSAIGDGSKVINH